MFRDERLDPGPLPAGQPTPDPRHVNGSPEFQGPGGDPLQARGHNLIPDGRTGTAPLDPALADHVGDPDVRLDLDELHGPESEPAVLARCVPPAVLGLRLLPPPRD